MLFLKSLDITGFKSFARSTRFEFTPGITALVGPNGSGKSNVVDAIRWCLGEQSVRDLRGQRAEDNIYAGSRHVLGVAEVFLTFTPADDEAASRGDAVVGRRIYRSGESEYLVDGRKVRLRDLTDRLRKLGIDGSRHIVVTQGMADALLSAAPAERRSLLEHAAGLSGYRVRRDEARLKLGTTEQNIATIALVLDELEPRLRALRRQACAVQDRAEAQALLQRRLIDWYANRWKAASADLGGRMASAERIATERQAAENQLAELEASLEATSQRERAWQQTVEALVSDNHALERDRDTAERVRSEIVQKLESAGRQREGAEARRVRAHSSVHLTRQRIAEVIRVVEVARGAMDRLKSEAEVLDLQVAREREGLREAEGDWEGVRRAATTQEKEIRVSVEHGEALSREIERAVRRRQDVDHALESMRAAIRDAERETAVLAASLQEAAAQTDALTVCLEAEESAATTWRTRETRLDVLAARIRTTSQDVQRRSDRAQRYLQSLGANGNEPLLQELTVMHGWETAIAAALGEWAFATIDGNTTSVHEDRDVGFAAWRASLDAVIGSPVWADSLVRGMPEGRVNLLRTSVVVETDVEARRVWTLLSRLPAHTVGTSAVSVVTKGGVCWNAVGRQATRGDDRAAMYLRRKQEAARLRARLVVLTQRTTRVEAARAEAVARCKRSADEMGALQAALRTSRNLTSDLEGRLARLQRQLHDLDARTAELRAERDELADRIVTSRAEHSRWKNSKDELMRAMDAIQVQLENENARVEAVRRRVSALDTARLEVHHNFGVAAATHDAQASLLFALQAEQVRLQEEIAAEEVEASAQEVSARRLEDELTIQAEEVSRLTELLEEHSATLKLARAARPEQAELGDTVRERRAAVSLQVRRHEQAQAEIRAMRERMHALASDVMAELQLQPDALRPSDHEPPSEAELKRLRSRAMQYADAEPAVVDEAQELAERHSYLLKHVQDLREAATTLRDMMEVADAEMRSQFDDAFVAVSEEFSRVFEVMLRGGRARLEQLDGGGIEVVAQLPGKRSRSSAAFSGGERSLIASSLLFGILKMRPAPFCVLDEVDAALDESNVDRYLAALRDISRRTQVVVVTHNRATMAAADVLYGMTMNTEGSSSVLSLRLDSQEAG